MTFASKAKFTPSAYPTPIARGPARSMKFLYITASPGRGSMGMGTGGAFAFPLGLALVNACSRNPVPSNRRTTHRPRLLEVSHAYFHPTLLELDFPPCFATMPCRPSLSTTCLPSTRQFGTIVRIEGNSYSPSLGTSILPSNRKPNLFLRSLESIEKKPSFSTPVFLGLISDHSGSLSQLP